MIINGIQGVTTLKIYAKDGQLAHMVFSMASAPVGREDLSPVEEGLQVAALKFPAGKAFQRHKHLDRPRTIPITQEAWIVLSGVVKVDYFDVNGVWLSNAIIVAGDISITFRGGHGYTILRDAEIFEVKLGPFASVNDKEYLG